MLYLKIFIINFIIKNNNFNNFNNNNLNNNKLNIKNNLNIHYYNLNKINIINQFDNNYYNKYNLNNKKNNFYMMLKEEDNCTTNNTEYDNFPSFYTFLNDKKIKEINDLKHDNIKLLKYNEVNEYTINWIYEMVTLKDYFPTFMYQDMFNMRDYSYKNITKNYFYIGYYPINKKFKTKEPFYIGAFELIPKKKEFQLHLIIQNPNYLITDYEYNTITEYKEEIMSLCRESFVFLKYENLTDTRYYYSWKYF